MPAQQWIYCRTLTPDFWWHWKNERLWSQISYPWNSAPLSHKTCEELLYTWGRKLLLLSRNWNSRTLLNLLKDKHPIAVIPKKDGHVRICVDMRVPNRAIKRERLPNVLPLTIWCTSSTQRSCFQNSTYGPEDISSYLPPKADISLLSQHTTVYVDISCWILAWIQPENYSNVSLVTKYEIFQERLTSVMTWLFTGKLQKDMT